MESCPFESDHLDHLGVVSELNKICITLNNYKLTRRNLTIELTDSFLEGSVRKLDDICNRLLSLLDNPTQLEPPVPVPDELISIIDQLDRIADETLSINNL